MTAKLLADDFDPPTHDAWVTLVEETLKGADFEKKLVWRSHDGLRVEPLYSGTIPLDVPGRSALGWNTLQRVDIPDIATANRQLLEDLEGGAAGLVLVSPQGCTANGFGTRAETADDFDKLLQGVYLDMIPVRLDGGWRARKLTAALVEVYEKRGHDLSKVNFSPGLDPLGSLAHCGHMLDEENTTGRCGKVARNLIDKGLQNTTFLADGRLYHNAGASPAQELAFALATATQYLRWMRAESISPQNACDQIGMLLAIDADMFISTAKLRAARILWARVQEAMDLKAAPLMLHAETSWRMMTRRDPHVNLLRTTAATFAAGIAGADSLTVLPFTSALGLPDGFARRMARNTQSILIEESHLGQVQDPGAGSGFFDQTALDLATIAWKLFQKIEGGGGMLAALTSGDAAAMVTEARAGQDRDVATRREPITGVSEFPDLAELPVAVLENTTLRSTGIGAADNGISCTPFSPSRRAEGFERLRDASDDYLQANGKRPSVFMANIGDVADFTARASWVGNVFEAGGIEALRNDGFLNPEEAAAGFSESGCELAVICSSDKVYEQLGPETVRALAQGGANHVYVAGQHDRALAAAGTGTFIHIGCDILSILSDAHAILGIAK
jgi:methylmalonyl-CoA mutase